MNNQELNFVQGGKYGKFFIAFLYSARMGNTGNAEVLWMSIAEGDKSVQSILLCHCLFCTPNIYIYIYIYISLTLLP